MLAAAVLNARDEERSVLEESLRRFLDERPLNMEVFTFGTAESFWEARKLRYFDLVFLTVRQETTLGMDLARKLRERDREALLVLVSPDAYWAVESYRVRAHDYLMWPFTQAQFNEVMGLCYQTLHQRRPFIEVKEGRLTTCVLLDEIYFTDYHNHYIQIHLKERVIRTYMSFADFAERMAPHPRFLCCYRNVLVNMDQVAELDDKDFVLRDGSRVPISRSERHEIHQRYQDYSFAKGNFR